VPFIVHGTIDSQTWPDGGESERFEVTTTVGYIYDETRFFWNTICGGVFDRFPDLKIIITHGGGFVPYQLGRLEACNAVLTKARNEKPLTAYLDNFWFDPMIHDLRLRQAMVEVIGADKLVYGDNFWGSDGIRENIVEGLDLSAEDKERILSRNAIELLRLPVTVGAA
jgi:predicted TIM-barrel fold metal-dependent hydrolase